MLLVNMRADAQMWNDDIKTKGIPVTQSTLSILWYWRLGVGAVRVVVVVSLLNVFERGADV